MSRTPRSLSSRSLLLALAAVAATGAGTLTQLACSPSEAAGGRSVIVLGFDGMDHALTQRFIAEGRLPNFERLAESGAGQALGTSIPPLSPVAWSNFITGMDGGGHGIYDFIHRDPETMIPYLSTSVTEPAGKTIKVGKYQFALSGGETVLMRRGQPFWEVLEDRGVETTIMRMPANFPPSGTATRELSGMGTPDVIGSYGTFSFFTSEIFFEERDLAGGEIYLMDYWNGIAEGTLFGPKNEMLIDASKLERPFRLLVDVENDTAKLEVGDEERVLAVGEWTDWIPIGFDLPLMQELTGMARFYLRAVDPEVELYVSPINFDPLAPATPISTPNDYARELAEATGRFYTQGMPEDVQALKGEILTQAEFMQQARIVDRGLLFYYFGNLDQVSHMMLHATDDQHPTWDEEQGRFAEVLGELYQTADRIVGQTLDRIDGDTTLIVMSDHGFASWRRSFNLNTWLKENGYLALKDPNLKKDPGLFLNVDWSRTRAYGLGMNGLYINVKGREKNGIVEPADRLALVAEISEKLLAEVDPVTEQPTITKVYSLDEVFERRDYPELSPDIVVGYAKGTRGSSDSALGEIAPEVYSDNVDDWGADHGMDHTTVPGILFANRPLGKPVSDLTDLAAAIVAEFGVDGFPAGP
jgi:predicted AlkP superfamily phosphohydrolase/phosphomutase